MKNKLLLAALFFPLLGFAQVGVNTTTPAATLDIVSKNTTGTSTNVDGLLIPRVDRQRAQSMTGVTTSTMIYVNNIATGSAAGTAINVDAVGYYYFNGTVWVKLNSSAASNVNIYNADGTLTGNRIVTQGANTLTFNASSVNAFSIDGETFSVDAANNRVGINNDTPQRDLHIGSTTGAATPTLRFTTGLNDYAGGGVMEFLENNNAYGTIIRHHTGDNAGGTQREGLYFNTYAANVESATPTLMLDQVSASVGIGTATPQKKLHVAGSMQLTNELNVGGNATTAGSAGIAGQYLRSNGPGVAPTWNNIIPNTTGTLIAVNGQIIVAQEITVQMTADYALPASATGAQPIGNLNNEIIDNENQYAGTATSNSFKVTADGTYQIIINLQMFADAAGNPVVGIWNDTSGSWVARVNDYYATANNLQTYTLITSVPMLAANTYSFRFANTNVTTSSTIRALSTGSTGNGPVTQVSVKRLK